MRRNKQLIRKKIILIVLIILLIPSAWFVSQYAHYQQAIKTPIDSTDTSSISFIVKKGENVSNIAKNLVLKKLLRGEDTKVFELYARFNNLDRSIIPGRFALQRNMTIPQILEVLMAHDQNEVVLTIPEGSTIRDIDQKLAELELIQTGDFIKATKNFNNYEKYSFLDKKIQKELPYPLEGYLFPDTYFIDESNFSVENVIEIMLGTFQKKALPLIEVEHTNLHQIVTMASILEKEVNTDKDIPFVSGILWKRLENDWTIGADATLLYIADDREITYEELQNDNHYNTRKNKGLPPGPIGNPGLATIQASSKPKESPYWFYLTDKDGAVIYSKTNEEHNINKNKYL